MFGFYQHQSQNSTTLVIEVANIICGIMMVMKPRRTIH